MWENYRITVTNPLRGKEEYYYNGYSGYSWHVKPQHYIPWQSREINNYALGVPKTRYYFTGTVGERGEISSIRYPAGNTVTYTYDPSTGERTGVSDSAGNTIQYTYNDMGRVTSLTDAKGTKTDFTYSTNNVDLIQVSNGLGTVNMTYNAQHDILSITDRMNTTTAFTYNDKGQRTSVTEAQGVLDRVTKYSYDPATAKLLQISQGSNTLSSYTYDAVGRVKTSTDASGLTLSYDYNDLNYLTRTSYPDGKFSEKTYGSCCPGMITSETDRSGKTTTYFYDELKRRVKTVHPDKTVTRAEYDANGNLITLLDSNSNATRFSYDLNDRLIKKTYADGKSEELVYNNLGQLEQQLNGRGIAVTYAYDSNYNLLSVAYSDDTPGVTYQYDAYNRLIEQQDGIGTTKYSYDANSKILTVDGPWDNDTLTYQYDVLGRRTGVTPQSGTAISYSYDTLNRLTQIESNSRSYTYAYNGINPLVQSLTRPNGSSTAYLYDSLNRLTSIANTTSADAVLTRHIFTYNAQDLRGSEDITRTASATSPAEQLITSQYNALNQLLEKADPAKAFVYDDDGNMTQGYTPDGSTMTAAYDAENRLTRTEFTDTASVTHRTEYQYGADNLLRRKLVYANDTLAAEHRYVLDGFNVLQECDGSNAVLREYTWGLNRGGGIGGLLELREGGQHYSYLYDGKGNVDGLIDDAEVMVAGYVYSPFGRLLTKTGTLDQPFRFSTKAFDEQTGLAYYGYRFYAPSVGRWINRDPIGEVGGINLYGFVNNNPVNGNDINGLIDPLSFRKFPDFHYYGNWGGPGWTAGEFKSWDDFSEEKRIDILDDIANNPKSSYAPVDNQDRCYMRHDICYGKRRNRCKTSSNSDECLRSGLNSCDKNLGECLGRCGVQSGPIKEIHRLGAMPVFNTIQPGVRNAIDHNKKYPADSGVFLQFRF